MIARLWSAKGGKSQSLDYLEHFNDGVVPELRKLPGYVGASVLTRDTAEGVEIMVVTLWHSFEAIKEFAGADPESAVVAPAAAAVLTSYDDRVRHFEVAIVDRPDSLVA